MGDVILNAAVLESKILKEAEVDFLVGQEFAELLQEHPRVQRVWTFDRRKSALRSWIQLCQDLRREKYDEVWDLHGSLRTRIAKWILKFRPRGQRLIWRSVARYRWKTRGQWMLGGLWPTSWKPPHRLDALTELCGEDAQLKPNFRHLVHSAQKQDSYVTVMPASRWRSKEWPTKSYVEVLKNLQLKAVVLGRNQDPACQALLRSLEDLELPYESLLETADLKQTATALAGSAFFLGADTGLAHLAMSLGVASTVLLGPTGWAPAFEPWTQGSLGLKTDLLCQPCGKDGRLCKRFWEPYACLTGLNPATVLAHLQKTGGTQRRWSLRMRVYRSAARWIFGRLLRTSGYRFNRAKAPLPLLTVKHKSARRIWFHAASVGELESLLPLVERLLQKPEVLLVITAWSASAQPALERLKQKWKDLPQLHWIGMSPGEGFWSEALADFAPETFVTARYEAWPELWASLSKNGIKLFTVSAAARNSIRWAKRLLNLLGESLPQQTFQVLKAADAERLLEWFPLAKVRRAGDPRLDRVLDRADQSGSILASWKQGFEGLPKPWGILGSIWREDFEVLQDGLQRWLDQTGGTLWVVPHQLHRENLDFFGEKLKNWNPTYTRSSKETRRVVDATRAVLVDEMGKLLELYSLGDWAFVGGGFTKNGVHNTLEPAVFGLPILIGPAKAKRFPEIELLQERGQLHMARDATDCSDWINRQVPVIDSLQRLAWKKLLASHRGVTDHLIEDLWSQV